MFVHRPQKAEWCAKPDRQTFPGRPQEMTNLQEEGIEQNPVRR